MPTTINTPRDTTIQATNTALGLLGKDASLQDIKTALLQIVAALTPSIDNDYEELINKPSINSVSLVGNKTSKQLGIRQIIPMTSAEYAQLSSAEKLDDDIDYLITDRNAVSVPIDDDNVSVNKVWSSDKVDSTKVDKENVLNTVEECSASTDLEDVAGASAVSALNSSITAQETPITTSLTPASVTVIPTDNFRTSAYVIRAGICFVNVSVQIPSAIGDVSVAVCALPNGLHTTYKPPAWSSFGALAPNIAAESLFQNGVLYIRNATADQYSINFSYPVI